MQRLEIEAVYEHGTLKLPCHLPIQDGQKVTITIHLAGGAVRRLAGLIPWTGERAELERFLNDPDEGVLGDHDV
jgi:predicted DNA-binding antitoxin AbrB/MazE fold protein